MKQIDVQVEEIKCDSSKCNKTEIEFWKKQFLSKKPIPSPWVNERNEVVAFHNVYFALKELKFSKVSVVPPQ